MTIEERKAREKDEMRKRILDTAMDIITEEGIEKLSIRKIAAKIEYSPAIIYHYFHDKDEIINYTMKKSYQEIVNKISSIKTSENQPDERLKKMIHNYIDAALQMPDTYKNVKLSNSPAILEHTSSLFEGAYTKKTALSILMKTLKDIYKDKNIADAQIGLTAQIIAASTFGLIIKLITEKEVITEEQKENLITHYISCIVDGMVMRKEINSI